MISAALDFVHARKWVIELILLVVIVGAAYWFCHQLIDVGVQRQKDADDKAIVELQRNADIETGRLKGKAEAAEHAHDQELTDLRKFRDDHPLHGGLCDAHGRQGREPQASAANSSYADPGAGKGNLQPVPSRDFVSGSAPDQLGMLDVLAARCDAVSATLREYQAR